MKEKYNIFGFASAIYAVFLTFCLYHNTQGITFPFFVAGTLFYFCYSMKKCGGSPKKDDWFYFISLMLLGISVFLTADTRIILIAQTGIFLLMISFLLHHFYQDETWNFTKYIQSILEAVIYTIGSLFAPVKDMLYYQQNYKKPEADENGNPLPVKSSQLKYFLFGLLIAIPLLIVVLFSLSCADVVFRDYLNRFFELIQIETIIGVTVMTIAGYFLSYALIHSLLKKEIREKCPDQRTKEPVLAITFTSVITLVYVLFCAIQIFYLFTGNLALPDGYTYAEYARQGFYELLFVCIMNVVILLVCIGFFKESNVLKIILSVITVCTYIMIASSAYRMYLYVGAYHFTFLRLMVFFFLIVIAVLMLGIFTAIFKTRFPLFKYCMTVITVFTIILAYSHPDYLIAAYNISHIDQTPKRVQTTDTDYAYSDDYYEDYSDIRYLTGLSQDAAPILFHTDTFHVLHEIAPQYMEEYYARTYYKTAREISLRTFNLSKYLGKKAFQGLDLKGLTMNPSDYPEYNPDSWNEY